MRYLLTATLLLTLPQTSHAFGHKKMNLSEVKGVTEAQLVKSAEADKVSVMVRGKGAEFLFRTLKEKRVEQIGSAALELAGSLNNTHWTVEGKQVTCSRIQNTKTKKEDFACAFEVNAKGSVAANIEPFSPSLFNLVKTKTQARLFPKKKKSRGLASAVAPQPASAYAMYDAPEGKKNSEDALFVFQGPAATEMMGFLADNKNDTFQLAGANGVKGSEISCVAAKKAGDPDRCALVVSLSDGSVSTRANPLFR